MISACFVRDSTVCNESTADFRIRPVADRVAILQNRRKPDDQTETGAARFASASTTNAKKRMRLLLGFLMVLLTLSGGRAPADDDQVWTALKQGGKVILLRHTHVVVREPAGDGARALVMAGVDVSRCGTLWDFTDWNDNADDLPREQVPGRTSSF